MARINIEDSLFKDPRFIDLILIEKGDRFRAMGILYFTWALAQHWFLKSPHGTIPDDAWERSKIPNSVITTEFAERTSTGVYVRGAKEQFAWLTQRSKAGRENIKKFNERSLTDDIGRTSSSSSSSSFSNSLKKEEYIKNKNEENLPKQIATPSTLPKKVKRSRFTEETRIKMQKFFARYSEKYKEKYGCNPQSISDPAILGKVGSWLGGVSESRAVNLIEVYLQIDYRPINEAQHDLWKFFYNLNRIGNALDSGHETTNLNWKKIFGDKHS